MLKYMPSPPPTPLNSPTIFKAVTLYNPRWRHFRDFHLRPFSAEMQGITGTN